MGRGWATGTYIDCKPRAAIHSLRIWEGVGDVEKPSGSVPHKPVACPHCWKLQETCSLKLCLFCCRFCGTDSVMCRYHFYRGPEHCTNHRRDPTVQSPPTPLTTGPQCEPSCLASAIWPDIRNIHVCYTVPCPLSGQRHPGKCAFSLR